MTDTTTADILAAHQLIEEHGLSVTILDNDMWRCAAGDRSVGPTWVAAVHAWAEAAGVPWPAVKVLPMYYISDATGFLNVLSWEPSDMPAGWSAVECDVVIRESEGV